ncbi:Kip1 ubiquitination-promoting complex protein 1 [Mytilus galloprovincialis]|uniref:Kip1 ubiquitination-promoting complex protein 1 n=1 Tax=Mytilus galloprovincialis TaxID=29158 RepID=A0A8B6BHE9_MYTGA|nr:Kip1 ubiquitination-promoting complex protein 1 [Mytilus galloprovincialis]
MASTIFAMLLDAGPYRETKNYFVYNWSSSAYSANDQKVRPTTSSLFSHFSYGVRDVTVTIQTYCSLTSIAVLGSGRIPTITSAHNHTCYGGARECTIKATTKRSISAWLTKIHRYTGWGGRISSPASPKTAPATAIGLQRNQSSVRGGRRSGHLWRWLDDYPPLEMPSGNSLMELLDGLVMMYHIAAHKQLGKRCNLRDNMKEFVESLQDTQEKINRCPPDEDAGIKEELNRAYKVFLSKIEEQSRKMAWVTAVTYSKTKRSDIEWLLKVVLQTIKRAAGYKLLFQYVPEYYILTAINAFNALFNFFHPTVPFESLDSKIIFTIVNLTYLDRYIFHPF